MSEEAKAVSEFKKDHTLLGVLAGAYNAHFLANDSMGPFRDPKTDLIPQNTIDALGCFGEVVNGNNKIFVVTTAGPKIEGSDILKALGLGESARNFAVVENGGLLLVPEGKGNFKEIPIAHPEERKKLTVLEAYIAQDPLMQIMQNDKEVEAGKKPMRTHYETSLVLTLPSTYEEFCQRLEGAGFHDLEKIIPGIDASNYVNEVLAYARDLYSKGIHDLNLEDALTIVVKGPNRRIYITTKHNKHGIELNKRTGTELAATILHNHMSPFSISGSIYTADAAVDKTDEGAVIIGLSERPMILGPLIVVDNLDQANGTLVNVKRVDYHGKRVYIAQPAARLVFNARLRKGPITMRKVEGVNVIDVEDGVQALRVQEEIYRQLHV